MIGGFNIGDFDVKSPIAKIKLRQIKALYGSTNTVIIILQQSVLHYHVY